MSERRDRSRSPPGRYNLGPRGGGGGMGRRKYQIIIKNLPFDVDWKRLKNFVKVNYFLLLIILISKDNRICRPNFGVKIAKYSHKI